jgi:hypothetical protein
MTRTVAKVLTVSAGLLACLIRLVPHPPNLTPVGALGLFGGARLRLWQALALPLAAMVVTDFALWLLTGMNPAYPPWTVSRVFVYGSFLLYVPIGRALVRSNSLGWVAAASVLGSLQFYLITNFGVWLMQTRSGTPLYTPDLSGLLTCYLAGLPFYQGQGAFDLHGFCLGTDGRFAVVGLLLGDLAFSVLLFRLHAWLLHRAAPAEQVRLQPSAES